MKLAIGQIKPFKGNIEKNISVHLKLIDKAIVKDVDAIFFPELSITGYEPELAQALSTTQEDDRFAIFQEKSNVNDVCIGIGVPTKSENGICISMVIFQPNELPKTYSKQYLHEDELPYFVAGKKQITLNVKGKYIVPAICYESLLSEHLNLAIQYKPAVYLASVAKHQQGVEKAYQYFSEISKKHSIVVAMSNAVGSCDNFISAGQSAIWNRNGELVTQLDQVAEDIIVVDVL